MGIFCQKAAYTVISDHRQRNTTDAVHCLSYGGCGGVGSDLRKGIVGAVQPLYQTGIGEAVYGDNRYDNDCHKQHEEQMQNAVPTGNFGDILAGYLAKRLGLPVGRLICASNANNVLTDFLTTGVYDRRRPLLKTTSPSMDILVSSNLERLLYLLSGDTELVAGLMGDLNEQGFYRVPEALLSAIQAEFAAGCCTDTQAEAAIAKVYRDYGYLMDPHTACGWIAAEAQKGSAPMVVLSTASPYKFSTAVLTALGGDTSGNEYQRMDRLSALTGVPVPKNLSALQGKPERHTAVIPKDKMLSFVLTR